MNIKTLEMGVAKTRELLNDKANEWKPRYREYAARILENTEKIKQLKKKFHQWTPLYVYMAAGEAKNSASTFNLRYQGQAVADIKFKGDEVCLDTRKYQENNKKYSRLNWAVRSK